MPSPGSKAARARARVLLLAALLVAAGAAGCGGSVEIAMTPLAGTIGGVPWTLASAESSAFLSDGSPTFFVTAYGQSLAACVGAASSATGNELILNVPKTKGDYVLSLSLTQTFYVRSTGSNLVSAAGRMRVDQVTDTLISGGAHFAFDGDNEVNGVFTATVCAQ
jgi:hypothetical protein